MMTPVLPFLVLHALVPTSQFVIPFGWSFEQLGLHHYVDDDKRESIDLKTLGTVEPFFLDRSLTITFADSVVASPFIENIYLTMVMFDGTSGFLEWYNGFETSIDLASISFIINQTGYTFASSMMEPNSTIRVPLTLGVPEQGDVDVISGFVLFEPPTSIMLRDSEQMTILERVLWDDIITTRFGTIPTSDHGVRRMVPTREELGLIPASAWVPFPLNQTITPFDPLAGVTTSLEQAKAWATYVMFGAGMFAAGRVEEAFRALEEQYVWMHETSQLLLFSEPNTQITGINERGNADRSTFREAVGRYNYLAARVPGASGLINPNPSPFPVLTLSLIGGALMGLFGVFAYIKSRYQNV
jgi:hypothetical protein